MTLELITRSYAHALRTDRASQELRAYVRSEWRGDASWLRREPSRLPLRARLRAWLASPRPTPSTPSPASDAAAPEEPSATTVPVGLVEPCPHPDPEALGVSGSAVFLQCVQCGDVLVVDQDREWCFCAAPSDGPEGLLRA